METNGDVIRRCSDKELADIFFDIINRHLSAFDAALPDAYVGELVAFLGSEYVEVVPDGQEETDGMDQGDTTEDGAR